MPFPLPTIRATIVVPCAAAGPSVVAGIALPRTSAAQNDGSRTRREASCSSGTFGLIAVSMTATWMPLPVVVL